MTLEIIVSDNDKDTPKLLAALKVLQSKVPELRVEVFSDPNGNGSARRLPLPIAFYKGQSSKQEYGEEALSQLIEAISRGEVR